MHHTVTQMQIFTNYNELFLQFSDVQVLKFWDCFVYQFVHVFHQVRRPSSTTGLARLGISRVM